MQWNNEVTRILKVDYPIVQAPMLGVTTPEMVAAVSNNGGLGSLPVGGLSPQQTLELIQKTKTLTSQPFSVNLFAHTIPALDLKVAEEMHDFLKKLCLDNQLTDNKLGPIELKFYSYLDQIQVLIDENIPIVSFTFGVLNDESIQVLKSKGVVLIGTATCLEEALLLEEKGIDIITAQGSEAGGHRGTFLDSESLPLIGSMALITQLADRLKNPVLAAGGIFNGQTVKAAFILGAQGVQIGSAFICSPESAAIPSYKAALQRSSGHDTVLTKSFSGRWARGIRNKFIIEVEKSGLQIPDYPIQTGLSGKIRMLAQKQNNPEFTALWAGQSCSGAEAKPAAEILAQLIKQTEEL